MVSSSRVGQGSLRRQTLAPLIADDPRNDSHCISASEFLAKFLNVTQRLLEDCRSVFSFDGNSQRNEIWHANVEVYKTAAKEVDQYTPFLNIINAVLDHAAEHSEYFPGFERCLQFSNQYRKSPPGGAKQASAFPDILCEASIKEHPDAPSFWERVLLPIEFKLASKATSLTGLRPVAIGDGRLYPRPSQPAPESQSPLETPPSEPVSVRGKRKTSTESTSGRISKRSRYQIDPTDEAREPSPHEQLALYCLEMFSTGLRVHSYGALLDSGKLSLYRFDRDGLVYSEPFDVFDNWTMFTAMLVGLSSFNAEQWGFYPSLRWDTSRCLVPIVDHASKYNLDQPTLLLHCEKEVPEVYRLVQDSVTAAEERSDFDDVLKKFPLDVSDASCTEAGWANVTLMRKIYVQSCLIGRGTTLFKAKQQSKANGPDIVVKFSSQAVRHTPERFYVRYARKGLAHAKSSSVRNLPVLLGWAQGHRLSDGPRCRLERGQIDENSAADRIVHVLAFPHYSHIYSLKTEAEFKSAFRGCINCSYEIYSKLDLLHRDISSENLMWDPRLQCGILNDLDLAKLRSEMRDKPSAKHKTGTLPFMAADLLFGWEGEHLFRFELESYLYVIMWIVARYEAGKQQYEDLGAWLSKSPEAIRNAKVVLLTSFHQPKNTSSQGDTTNGRPWTDSKTYPNIYHTWIDPLLRLVAVHRLKLLMNNLVADTTTPPDETDDDVQNKFPVMEFLDILKR